MKIIECPRDAMQGLETFIPTEKKIQYINKLLQVGFDTIDFGSFVSPKAIPQMRDTAEVLAALDLSATETKLLAIVANTRGAEEASRFEAIHYLGFPLSISETFQMRNTNKTIAEALSTLDEIQNICAQTRKTPVTYISMGFGNPYGDPYDADLVGSFVDILRTLGIRIISIADTVGLAKPSEVKSVFASLAKAYGDIELGAHLHSRPDQALAKIESAYEAGCRRFDGAVRGYGGCPMANDALVGNIATETIINFLRSINIEPSLNGRAFNEALALADVTFPGH